jgi:hypothetical protein
VVAERDRVDAGREHLVRELRRDADAVGEVLAIQDAEVGAQLLAERRETFLNCSTAGNADGVRDEQDSQGSRFAAARSSIDTWFPASCV